jgi:hypothetical protein
LLALAATPYFFAIADSRSLIARSRERQRVDIRRLAFVGLLALAATPYFFAIADRRSPVAASASEWCFDYRPNIIRRRYQ